MGLSEETPFSRLLPMAGTKPSLRPFLLLLIAAAWSSCGSPTRPTLSSSSSSPTGVYVTPGGPTVSTTLSRIGDTFQLSATQNFSTDGPRTVTDTATWQSSNTAVATVSGGLVTAIGAGMVTITATYQGKSGTANISVAPGSVVTAVVDGVAFNAIEVRATRTTGGFQIYVVAADALTDPHFILTLALPGTVGTYDLVSDGDYTWVSLSETTTPFRWSGASGTITLSTVTSTSASGRFSFTLANGMTHDTKVVTNGVFMWSSEPDRSRRHGEEKAQKGSGVRETARTRIANPDHREGTPDFE